MQYPFKSSNMKIKYSIVLILSVLISSCTSSKDIKTHTLAPLDKRFSHSFTNISIKKESSNNKTSILQLLGIPETAVIDTVKLEIQENGQLKIEYDNPLEGKKVHFFKGKFKKHYYQVFLQRNQVIVPPIYWVTHIERLRFSISKDNLLVINEYREHSGLILFMGGGSGSKLQYCFKNVEK